MAEKLIFATSNQGKLREIRLILGDLGMEVISMAEAGFHGDIEENGKTFAENAAIKARAVWEKTDMLHVTVEKNMLFCCRDMIFSQPEIWWNPLKSRFLL